MADDGMLGLHWGAYYRAPPLTGNLGLQLMPGVGERNTKPFFSDGGSGGYPQRECGVNEPGAMPMGFSRGVWYHNNRDNIKMLNVFLGNQEQQSHSYGAFLPEATSAAPSVAGSGMHTLQMLQPVEPIKEERILEIEGSGAPQHEVTSLKKRSKGQGRQSKASKPKKAKKAPTLREDSSNPFGKGKSVNKAMDMVINGIDLDLSGMPAPVCTCTGRPQQCYRWGAGGWQSACCTTTISVYPLPMSTKRRGARIAGRKMSQGAFKKVLEKLAGEGQDFSSPIDLKLFWAKHGTNKFVTIRL